MDKTAVVETTTDVVEAALDTVEAVPQIVKNNPVVLVGVAVVSAAVGAGVATLISKRHFKLKYEKLASQEIAEARLFYKQMNKTDEYSDPSSLAEKYDDENPDVAELNPEIERETEMVKTAVKVLEDQKYIAYDKPTQTTEERVEVQASIQKNVFEAHPPVDEQEDDFDLDDELEKKAAGRPYIIEAEQFFENEEEHTQTALTWFEGDEVLVDERDQPIRNVEGVIGGVANLRFGAGSKDANMVYIRNDRFSADYEVSRSTGKYAEEVLGFIQHEDRRPPRKFRVTD